MDSISRNASAAFGPLKQDLYRQAEMSKGHISDKAVMDEYNRLVADQAYRPPPRRTFWEWLWGS
jgi:hypothetical protein